MVQALVKSILSYGATVWMTGNKNLCCMDKITRACSRFVYCKSKFESISDYVNEMRWLYDKDLCKLEVCKLTYKMVNDIGPKFFSNYICQPENLINTRNRTYVQPQNSSNSIAKKSFQYRASEILYNLPDFVTQSIKNVSFRAFSKNVKSLLLDNESAKRMFEIFELIDSLEFDNMINNL